MKNVVENAELYLATAAEMLSMTDAAEILKWGFVEPSLPVTLGGRGS